MAGTLGFILMLVLYFLPTLNAFHSGHKNAQSIFAVNLLFGWTLIGWAVALIWSLSE